MVSDVVHIFMYFWPSICPLWKKKSIQILAHFLIKLFLLLLLSCISSLYMLNI